jgi:hypothetical protein
MSATIWKITYHPIPLSSNPFGLNVALVEGADHPSAMYNFKQQYAGKFYTVASCERL